MGKWKKAGSVMLSLFLILCIACPFAKKNERVYAKSQSEENVQVIPEVTMDGASIRVTKEQGIRFKITVKNPESAVDYGINITHNGKTKSVSIKNGYTEIYSEDTQNNQVEYVAVVTGLKKEHITKDFSAQGFATYIEDETEKTVTTETITRTISEVADAAGYKYDEETNTWVEKTQDSQEDGEIEEIGGYRIAKKSEGTSISENQDGSITVSFTNPYDAVYFAFPKGKKAADYFSATFDLMSREQFGLALTDKDGKDLKATYPAYTVTYDTRDHYVLSFDTLDTNDADECYIKLMTLKNVAYGNTAQNSPITIYDLTFRERTTQDTSEKTLLDAYGDIFGYVGNAGDLAHLKNQGTLDYYKTEYNSFTSGNEMKPDYILRENGNKTLISSSEAAEKYGYTIPEGYKEEQVPKLYFDVMDETLKTASENGIKMRGHTLIWHSQTPDWFFREGYSENGNFVTPEVMNERIRFYVTNVMQHVHKGEYKDVIYAWDVTNEYLHQGTDANKSGWIGVYGNEIVQNGKVINTPEYVKIAFQTADNLLREDGLRDDVHLFYNDYNTYGCIQDCIELIDYLNTKDSLNEEGNHLCDGIGMQSHLDVMWPNVEQYLRAVDAFAKKGYEIQITELDVCLNMLGNQNTEEEQTIYWKELMEGLLQKKKEGANITALVFWGLYDDTSWRMQYQPLLFSHSYYDKKEAYHLVIEAAEKYKEQ